MRCYDCDCSSVCFGGRVLPCSEFRTQAAGAPHFGSWLEAWQVHLYSFILAFLECKKF